MRLTARKKHPETRSQAHRSAEDLALIAEIGSNLINRRESAARNNMKLVADWHKSRQTVYTLPIDRTSALLRMNIYSAS